MRVAFNRAADAVLFLRRRKAAFVAAFLSSAGQEVLASLSRVCHAYETTYDPDAREHARREGHRDVWIYIQRQLQLTDAELYKIASGGYVPPTVTQNEEDDQ